MSPGVWLYYETHRGFVSWHVDDHCPLSDAVAHLQALIRDFDLPTNGTWSCRVTR